VPSTPLNITIEQGATFSQAVDVGASFNGLTPRGTLRRAFGGVKLADLTCTAVSGGNTTISLTAVQTAALTDLGERPDQREAIVGVWDLETESAGTVVRHRHGQVILSREATT
jgi:hypothetical protein